MYSRAIQLAARETPHSGTFTYTLNYNVLLRLKRRLIYLIFLVSFQYIYNSTEIIHYNKRNVIIICSYVIIMSSYDLIIIYNAKA